MFQSRAQTRVVPTPARGAPFERVRDAGVSKGLGPPGLLLAAVLLVALVLLACATPVNHDEGQYLAASVLAGQLEPFREFLYLQTPLQPFLTAPVAQLVPGWSFIALRLFSVLMGVASLVFVHASQRRLGVSARDAALAVVLMASTYIFQFSVSVFRNDALPTALLALGLWVGVCAVQARRHAWALWMGAGLALALAASAKVSFAIPLAAAGVAFQGIRLGRTSARRRALADAAAFWAGAAGGLLPCVLAWRAAPEAFGYGVIGYFATAPQVWYAAIGEGAKLGAGVKLATALGILALGPALAALVVAGRAFWRDRAGRRVRADEDLFVDVMIVAGLAAALMPSPTYRQYYMPLLPPLFMRLGAELPRLRMLLGWRRGLATAALSIGLAAGAGYWIKTVGRAVVGERWTFWDVAAEAHWVGARLRAAHVRGSIASLSPQVVLDSGYPLDPRFATGGFVYRTGDLLDLAAQQRLHVLGPSTLVRGLDAQPPGAIVTGYEPRLDGALRAYAAARGYRFERSPIGAAELFIRQGAPRVLAPRVRPPV